MASPHSRWCDDRGSVMFGWITRLALFFGITALALFDAISIGSTATTVADQGSYAALQASDAWQVKKSVQDAYDAAATAAAEQNASDIVATKDFTVDPDGTVHLTISRVATTMVVYRIGPIKNWAHIERRAHGRSVS